jgi:predicted membrane channel-forming protein YqfA (hemolysin III family)
MSVVGLMYQGIGGFTDISSILQGWADAGVFAYVLPFLLIFAVVFGILSRIKIFGEDNRAVNAIIALAVGLLSLQFSFVPSFFSQVFPTLGVGLSVLLVAIILMGVFINWEDKGEDKGWKTAFIIIGAVIALIVVLAAFSSDLWWNSWWWQEYSGAIILGIIIVAVIGVAIGVGNRGRRVGKVPD